MPNQIRLTIDFYADDNLFKIYEERSLPGSIAEVAHLLPPKLRGGRGTIMKRIAGKERGHPTLDIWLEINGEINTEEPIKNLIPGVEPIDGPTLLLPKGQAIPTSISIQTTAKPSNFTASKPMTQEDAQKIQEELGMGLINKIKDMAKEGHSAFNIWANL